VRYERQCRKDALVLSTLNEPSSFGELGAGLPGPFLEVDIAFGLFGLQTPHSTIIGSCCFLFAVKQLPVCPLAVHHHFSFPLALLFADPSEPAIINVERRERDVVRKARLTSLLRQRTYRQ